MRVVEGGEFKPDNFPPNSTMSKLGLGQGSDGVREKVKPEKIVTGAVVTKKPGLRKKISGMFFGSDGKTVTEYVIYDILVPALKSTVVEAIYAVSDSIGGGFEMLFFGEKGRRRRSNVYRDAGKSYVSYNSVYNDARRGVLRAQSVVARTRHDFDDIIIESRAEAEEVLSHLVEDIMDYGTATVASLYALVGIADDYPDQKYGWTDLRGATVVRVPNGYLLDLPRPILLD